MPRLLHRKTQLDENQDISTDKGFVQNYRQLNNLLGQANLSLYGTDRTSDVDPLNAKFQQILKDEVGQMTNNNTDDVTSFLNRLWSNEKKDNAYTDMMDDQLSSLMGEDISSMQSFIFEAYRNRLLEQADLHQVSSQLIELSEAILITRDAIISADVVEGRMSRTLVFNNLDPDDEADAKPIVEKIEERFELLEKIKNFIIPKTLEYGEYYAYIIPYSKIFNDFVKKQNGSNMQYSHYREFTLTESMTGVRLDKHKKPKMSIFAKTDYSTFINECYSDYVEECKKESKRKPKFVFEAPNKQEFTEDVTNILNNVSICNDAVPIPILEEGYASISKYMEMFVTESGTNAYTEKKNTGENSKKERNLFQDVNNGVYLQNDKGASKNKEGDFDDIRDCYVKLLDPTKVIPIEIMDKCIGYYLITSEDISPMQGIVSSGLGYAGLDERLKEHTVLDRIVDRIIKSFDKDFLKENEKFKEMIVEAINYYNLNEKRIKFQFIPAEYIQVFKIDQDEKGHGQSMIKKSLFYAKLYLMLLLFKIMSIILYSNDTKVNYIKSSGISKNIANKVQEIARMKQSRQINIMDLYE